ncbi:MAG: DUF4169 family protein [Pseudomonadota bacterium]
MSNIVNLNRFRKKKERAEKEREAEENRAKHGRRKGEIAAEKAKKKKQNDFLDGHRQDDDEA